MRRRSGTVTPTSDESANATAKVAADPARAVRWPAKRAGARRIRARSLAHTRASAKDAGSALHFSPHAAASAAHRSEAGERSKPSRCQSAEANVKAVASASEKPAAETASEWPRP